MDFRCHSEAVECKMHTASVDADVVEVTQVGARTRRSRCSNELHEQLLQSPQHRVQEALLIVLEYGWWGPDGGILEGLMLYWFDRCSITVEESTYCRAEIAVQVQARILSSALIGNHRSFFLPSFLPSAPSPPGALGYVGKLCRRTCLPWLCQKGPYFVGTDFSRWESLHLQELVLKEVVRLNREGPRLRVVVFLQLFGQGEGDAAMAQEVVNVDEYEALAQHRMPKMSFDYFARGSEDQVTLRENRAAFARIWLRPRILVDVSNIDVTTSVLGFKIAMPIMVAPTALHKLAHPDGECATARAASAANTLMILSSSASCSMEEIAATGPGVRFFQLYVYKDRNITRTLVRRADQTGFKAIVLTVDTPRLGRREADIKNRFKIPSHLVYKNIEGLMNLEVMDKTSHSELASWADSHFDRSLNWKDVKWLQSITKLPVLVKGILTAEDAVLALETGIAGIIVSNHGARQLDHVPATISVLEEVVKAVGGRVPVFLDGGVRRGTDVFKALALGASGVFVGRPIPYALAVDGEAGATKVLQMLRDEFELTMALMGVRSVKEIRREHVQTEQDAFKKLLLSKL